ncbi:PAS domain-containing protein [Myxococcus sp. K15C18031901]|uniref:PAS domain-containing sensor histidine kinase n=1 Tax=Myxococcus dinghuensis TaxID=2906761 RepID=UPI0020A75FE9|nr:PAS domain-containing protein [Myxococcus dinghuensis]MCP3100989.1 PAS domain-containing protein [Myxococcus dinghuensis]
MATAHDELSAWLDAAVDPLVACDADEHIRFLNVAAERLFDWKREDLVNQPVSRLFPERLRHFAGKSLMRYLLSRRETLGGRPIRILCLRRDGVEVLVELTVGTLGQGADERVMFSLRRLHEVIDTVREPVERTRQDAQVQPMETGCSRGGEDLYRLVVENAPLGIFHYDTTPIITACNAQLSVLIGSPKRVLVGLNLMSLRDERLMHCVRETLHGRDAEYDGRYHSVTGHKTTPVHIRFTPCYDDAGQVEGGIGIVEDVTERRRAEKERDESLALLATLFHTAPVGLGFLDTDMRYVRVNDVLARINQLPSEQHRGHRPSELLGNSGRLVEQLIQHVLDTGEPVESREMSTRELEIPGPEGFLAGSLYPVRAPGGRMLGVGVLVEDITQRKRAEAERDRLYREAQEAIRVRDDFLSIASHELKTPLTPLSLRLAALERKLEHGEHVDPATLHHARQHLQRITTLINDLLDASRIEAGRLALHPEATRLDRLVEGVVQSMDAQRGDHVLRYAPPSHSVQVFADPYRLEQVVNNLVDNALKYSPDGGTIDVTLEVQGGMALLSVKDPGIGIPEEQQRLLFDRYFRAHNVSSRSYGGLGLGLYISRDIVERHGGRIWVESAVGHGSTFHVALPVLGGAPLHPHAHPPASQPDRHVH